MPKKSIKDAAMKGASVFDTIARGADVLNVQDIQSSQDIKNALDVQNTKNVQNVRDKSHLERLNLKIPADLKAYLQAAAYRESSPTRIVSLTEYLCNLVRADMEKHTDE